MSADQAAHRMQRQFAASIGKEVACYTAKKAIENKEKSKLPTTITCDGLKEILDYGRLRRPGYIMWYPSMMVCNPVF